MKHYFTNRGRIILILALLLAVGLTVSSSLMGITLPDMLVKTVLTPLRTGVSKLTDKAEQLYNYVYNYEVLAAENAALKEQLAKMEENSRYADSVARENERLRDILELSNSREDFVYVDGYIISRSSQEFSRTVTIDTGSNAGIEPGMCAITANGEVVGLVSEVGSNYSVIKTVMDASLEISATIAATGYNGIVKGGSASGTMDLLRMNICPAPPLSVTMTRLSPLAPPSIREI